MRRIKWALPIILKKQFPQLDSLLRSLAAEAPVL